MRSVLVLVPEVGPGPGPDLTRYLAVCALSILGLLGLAWAFRRFAARHLRLRAARRSLQVLDVLPLGAKQRLLVVRCYDRSFLLGVGEKEVRSIAELDLEPSPIPSAAPLSRAERERPAFRSALARELERPGRERPAVPGRLEEGVVG